ncbi:MAG: uracil-DNA glycosylase [Candidatus Pacebacteria bacterium]|nr:uracil-DNA glycosylase [Candidatus Paceibacterota bacterium]
MAINKTEQMKKIMEEILNLKKSPLYAERIKNKAFPVIGEGDCDAEIVFVGEAPGKNEAKTGKPFCGASGRVLDELLDSIKLKREDVYVTNIVKDRPTANRDPSKDEIKIYGPFLDKQIEIIQPKIIATLGRYSAEYIMKRFGLEEEIETIGKMRGKAFEVKTSYGLVKIIPLLHPAVALYNSFSRDDLKKDFKVLENR